MPTRHAISYAARRAACFGTTAVIIVLVIPFILLAWNTLFGS